MSFDPSVNNPEQKRKKSIGRTIAKIAGGIFLVIVIASLFVDDPETPKKINKPTEKRMTQDEFNKQLENSVRESLGNAYGDFKIEYTNIKNTCRFKLTFENDLTDAEAHTIGTTGVRALLKEFKQTDEIKMVLNGRKNVYVKVYSMKLKTGGELRGTFKDRTYMGESTYRPDSDRIEWRL